jgi:hypothetical protein
MATGLHSKTVVLCLYSRFFLRTAEGLKPLPDRFSPAPIFTSINYEQKSGFDSWAAEIHLTGIQPYPWIFSFMVSDTS